MGIDKQGRMGSYTAFLFWGLVKGKVVGSFGRCLNSIERGYGDRSNTHFT